MQPLARNAQKEFLIGQGQGHMRHIGNHRWMASSWKLRFFGPCKNWWGYHQI